MEDLMGMKELYNVVLKANFPFSIGNRKIETGEVIAAFDNIQIANIQEVKSSVTAHGGYNDWSYVFWDTTKEVDLVFAQGIFSRTHLALLSNARLIDRTDDQPIKISEREFLETDENGQFELTHKDQNPTNLFIYKKETGEKIQNGETIPPYTDLIVDYVYDYVGGGQVIEIGNRLLNGFVTLEARTKTKDDITGKVRTGIFKIPKLKIVSELSMRLGENATPYVSTFKAVGYPTGSKGTGKAMELYFLNNQIDSDM